MNLRKIVLWAVLLITVFIMGILTGNLSEKEKIADLNKKVANLTQNLTETSEHAKNLRKNLAEISETVNDLETINKELKAQTQTIEKNLDRAINTSENAGSGVKKASEIATKSKKDLYELDKIIQDIKNRGESRL